MNHLYTIVLRPVSRSSTSIAPLRKTIKSEQNIYFCDLLIFGVLMTL